MSSIDNLNYQIINIEMIVRVTHLFLPVLYAVIDRVISSVYMHISATADSLNFFFYFLYLKKKKNKLNR